MKTESFGQQVVRKLEDQEIAAMLRGAFEDGWQKGQEHLRQELRHFLGISDADEDDA